MKITNHQETEIRRSIRDAYAIDPLISLRKLLDHLEKKYDRRFDYAYIIRLIKKVNKESLPDLDRESVEKSLKDLRETFRVHIEVLTLVSLGHAIGGREAPTYSEMATAARTLTVMKKILLDAEFDLGVHNKIKGEVLDLRLRPIPDDIRVGIIDTAKLWRIPSNLIVRKVETHTTVTGTTVTTVAIIPAQHGPITNPNRSPVTADPEFRVS